VRIALISTMRTAVPPPRSGSVELLVSLLAEDLAARGHEVTVFGPGTSTVGTRVLSTYPAGYHEDPTLWDWQFAEFMQLGLAYEHADEFDVIHSHVYCYALPFTRLTKTPTVHTFHICPTPDYALACSRYPEESYVLLTEFQRQFFGKNRVARIINNGIRTASFPVPSGPGEYLAFLGDLRESKGVLEAIDCAHRCGLPLRLAGPETEYYRSVVKQQVDGKDVIYVGEVDHAGKCELLHGAVALLFPVRALEACPTVILEALACGTPVVALAAGPLPELVEPGATGVLVETPEELAPAALAAVGMDRGMIRKRAVERFDYTRMTSEYLQVYTEAVNRSAHLRD
jgi:glycosyltransferase involved in cell wall biosynthesis